MTNEYANLQVILMILGLTEFSLDLEEVTVQQCDNVMNRMNDEFNIVASTLTTASTFDYRKELCHKAIQINEAMFELQLLRKAREEYGKQQEEPPAKPLPEATIVTVLADYGLWVGHCLRANPLAPITPWDYVAESVAQDSSEEALLKLQQFLLEFYDKPLVNGLMNDLTGRG